MDTKDKEDSYFTDIIKRQEDADAKRVAEIKKRHNAIGGSLFCFGIDFVLGYMLFNTLYDNAIVRFIFYILIGIGIILLLFVVLFFFDKGAIKKAQMDVDTINEEKELYAIRNEKERVLAEKQFKIHQRELKRYYDLNLSNIRFLSVFGIVLIILGVLIVIGSIIIYVLIKTNMVFSVVGIVSGILIDGIGAFFISMYTENMKMAIPLHSKLTGSNNFLLANLIVSKIDSQEKREDALLEISKSISSNKD